MKKKAQKAEEELFFRKLYVNEAEKDPLLVRRCSSANKIGSKKTIAVFDYKQTKKNANNFVRKINSKKNFKSIQEIEPNSQKPKAYKRK